MTKSVDMHKFAKPIVLVICLLPLLVLVFAAVRNDLGPDPAKHVVDDLGLWALRLLCLTLALTPLRLITGKTFWIRYRRMLGLYAFFYALLHVLAYTFLLFGAQWDALLAEVTRRPYIVVGAVAFLLLIPLAVTSTHAMQRRLGRRWVKLHRLVYVVALLALTHFTWLKKLGLEATWPYAVLVFLMFAIRIVAYWRRKSVDRLQRASLV
jgi:methionine sulfoxide reductase heme-binding subunit